MVNFSLEKKDYNNEKVMVLNLSIIFDINVFVGFVFKKVG